MFPCHHSPYEAGVLTRCLINKIHPCFAEKGGYTKNSLSHRLPIARRSISSQNRQFSWLCFLAPPVFPIPQWHYRIYSALQWRDRAGFSPVFPIKLFQAPVFSYSIFNWSAGPIKKLFTRTQRDDKYISLPIARGSNGDIKQAVLLTLLPCWPGLPDFSVTYSGLLGITVAGPCRFLTGLPY